VITLVGNQEYGLSRPPQTPPLENRGVAERPDSESPWLLHEVPGITSATEQLPVSVIPKWEPSPLQRQIDTLVKEFEVRMNTPRVYKFPYTGR
jgi:hypothetical protein